MAGDVVEAGDVVSGDVGAGDRIIYDGFFYIPMT